MTNTQSSLFGNTANAVKLNAQKRRISGGTQFYGVNDKTPEGILNEVETVHDRHNFYAMTSGGKDSITLTDWLAELGKLKLVVHIDTGVGIKMTTDFVKDYCQEKGWPLQIIKPRFNRIFASFVLQYGFPGPGAHKFIMSFLKFQTMREFAYTTDRKNHCLISGVRKFESSRRMSNFPEPISVDGNLWFAAPFFYRKDTEIYEDYIKKGLKKSPAYNHGLGTSGECMCGSFATFDEKMLIKKLDPHLADYIEWLEDGVQRFGTDTAKKRPTWGGNPKMSELEDQKLINEFMSNNPELDDIDKIENFVCGQECGPGTLRGETDF